MRRTGWAFMSLMLLTGFGGTAQALEPDKIHVQLNASPDKVKQAVVEVLTNSGYTDIAWKDGSTLKTGYREEFESVHLWMYRCCWGVVKSRVEASVTPGAGQTTELNLQVFAEGKRTLWEGYTPVKTPYPESSDNQLRLIKNKLHIVSHPYTTQSFFTLQ